MRRVLTVMAVALVMAAMMLSMSGLALAKGPTPNAHNCGGTSSRETIDALGGRGFGQLVSATARESGGVSDYTNANCGNTGP
jgi:hypothetical protein